MTRVKDIMNSLGKIAPFDFQEDYDNSGLIIGNPEEIVTGVLLVLDVTESVLEEAKSLGFNLIISHHPLIFKGIKQITPSCRTGSLVMKAIANNISVIAMHTNFDNVPEGVNAGLAKVLELQNLSILQPKGGLLKKLVTFCPVSAVSDVRTALFEAGAGHIGNYDSCSYNTEGYGSFRAGKDANPYIGEVGKLHFEPETRIETVYPGHCERRIVEALKKAHPYEEVAYDLYQLQNQHEHIGAGMIGDLQEIMDGKQFLTFVKQRMELKAVRFAGNLAKEFKRIAICGGSGAFLIKDAIKAGAQAYVTGDIKYHEFFDYGEQILLIDAGHYETERYSISLLSDYLTEKFSTFAVLISKINTNPVGYF
jgi:dinuclear metal center YbgI/SA1388 family protein